MRLLFLGDIVGPSGCNVVQKFLPGLIKQEKLDFVIANGENAADSGVGITEKISNELFQCGVNVITTGNHVWDQKETAEHIEKEKKLLLENYEPRVSNCRVAVSYPLNTNDLNVNIKYDITGMQFPQQNIDFILQSTRV